MNPTSPPRDETGKWISLALTIGVHLLLALFLFFGLRWQSSPPASLEVELSAPPPAPPVAEVKPAPQLPKPQPPKPEPKPQPKPEPKPELKKPEPKPEIATKKPDPKKPEPKPEPKKPEPKKPEPKPEPPKPEAKKPEPKPEPKRPEPEKPRPVEPPRDDFREQLAREAERANLERMMREDANRVASARSQAGRADYENRIRTKVRGNLLRPPGVTGDPEAVFKVVQLPGGEVLSVTLVRSSGIPSLDDAIERAIRRSSPLPLPDNKELFSRELELKFRPMTD